MKKSSVYNQVLRIKRLCLDSENCETQFHDSFPDIIINNHLKRVKNESREELPRPKKRGKNDWCPIYCYMSPTP